MAGRLASGFRVFQLDLRNHGNSPHAAEMDYPVMADDIAHFIDCHHLSRVILIGHSMGGKVAMYLALTRPSLVGNLVVLDIAPASYPHGYGKIFQAMKWLNLDEISSRSEAEQYLNSFLDDIFLSRFLLQNLVRDDNGFHWRINIPAIENNIEQITSFPGFDDSIHYAKSAGFVGGKNSGFITPDHHQRIFKLFPRAQIELINDAGHMLHIEQPEKLQEIIEKIIL